MNERSTVELRSLLTGDKNTETAFGIAYGNVNDIVTAIWRRRVDVLIER